MQSSFCAGEAIDTLYALRSHILFYFMAVLYCKDEFEGDRRSRRPPTTCP